MINLNAVDRTQAFRYMGFHGEPDEKLNQLADTCEQKLLSAVKPRYCWQLFQKQEIEFLLLGQDIQKHLEHCEQVILFCATLSQSTDTCIRLVQTNDILAGMMIDAMASAFTEQFCDSVESEILNNNFQNKYSTWRFSAGYGDMPLSIQDDFLQLIHAQKRIGVCVTDSGLMTPRKSVTAIIGLSDTPIEKAKKGCAICNLRQNCPYRAKGEHCN